jgi:hypothetical protein
MGISIFDLLVSALNLQRRREDQMLLAIVVIGIEESCIVIFRVKHAKILCFLDSTRSRVLLFTPRHDQPIFNLLSFEWYSNRKRGVSLYGGKARASSFPSPIPQHAPKEEIDPSADPQSTVVIPDIMPLVDPTLP